jgi:ActR/RegA family two-component response regulator
LVVDDERFWRDNYESSISALHVDSIRTAGNLAEARQIIDEMKFAAAVIDIGLDTSDETNVDGMRVMEKLRSVDDDTSIVVITGRSGGDVIDVVSESFQEFAAVATFAKKKVDGTLLRNAVTKGLQVHADKAAHRRLPAHKEIPHSDEQMVWEDQMMRALGIHEGVAVLHEFLEKLVRAYLPLVGTDDALLGSDPEGGIVRGAYWSRGIGRPVLITAGPLAALDRAGAAGVDGVLHGKYEAGEMLAECTMGKVRGTVHELRNYSRAQFNRARS